MIKAIIFDMDGVLIEAKDWHYDALNRALRLLAMKLVATHTLQRTMVCQPSVNWKCLL